MAEDGSVKASERQRRKRKWDQPAEFLVSPGLVVPGTLPLSAGCIPGISLPGVVPLCGPLPTNPIPPTVVTAAQLIPTIQNTSAIVQKLNPPKIQDELIAREIVINDAEATLRYKLTKRQTQEEIQASTGAVVITRGKYRPANGPPDTEKPLYLHISAGSHLKETAERIKAVDRAASMVEEILKPGQDSLSASTTFNSALGNGLVTQPFSKCLFLGFDPDPSINMAARIRGPNDQYINHIMNETGATVVLRGRGSGNLENSHAEAAQQPLHLYLTSGSRKSLDDARILAENLLDTICAECGASRISSCKVYNTVPPPPQLLAGVVSSFPGPTCAAAAATTPSTSLFAPSGVQTSLGPSVCPGTMQSGAPFKYGNPQPNTAGYSLPSVSGGASYNGYGGIYPHATPLQQVALALRQAPVPTTSSATLQTGMLHKMGSSSSVEVDKRPPQKRKFQELPVTSKGSTTLCQNLQQGSEFFKHDLEDTSAGPVSSMPPPKNKLLPCSDGMPPPPSSMPPPPPKFSGSQSPIKSKSGDSVMKHMPPPPPKFASLKSHPKAENGNMKNSPPPPKFSSQQLLPKSESGNATKKSNPEPVSDPLLKLVEYGEDDDVDSVGRESPTNAPTWNAAPKPFWAA